MKQRKNDVSIMEKISECKGITKTNMEVANMCQVYLRVIMISDIANVQGNAIPLGRLMGQWRQQSWLEWPDIPKPPPKAWEIFRQVMMKTFGTCTRIHNPTTEMALSVKLGQWCEAERNSKHPHDTRRRQHVCERHKRVAPIPME